MKTRLVSVAIVAVLIGVLGVPTAARDEGPPIFVEAQTWKCPTGGDLTLCAHLHAGGWLPLYQDVSGTVNMNVDLLLHHASGFANKILGTNFYKEINLVGDPNSTTPKLNLSLPYNSAGLAYDGWTPWDINRVAFQDTDGTTWLVRLKAGVRAVNGKPLSTAGPKDLLASAWIADTRYSNVTIPGVDAIALRQPKAGAWSLRVKIGSSQKGETRDLTMALDPDVHNGNFGQILYDVKNVENGFQTYPIPAAEPGFHKLMIRSSDEGRFGPTTIVGVLVIGYVVP
jgi:hypothetical protein